MLTHEQYGSYSGPYHSTIIGDPDCHLNTGCWISTFLHIRKIWIDACAMASFISTLIVEDVCQHLIIRQRGSQIANYLHNYRFQIALSKQCHNEGFCGIHSRLKFQAQRWIAKITDCPVLNGRMQDPRCRMMRRRDVLKPI